MNDGTYPQEHRMSASALQSFVPVELWYHATVHMPRSLCLRTVLISTVQTWVIIGGEKTSPPTPKAVATSPRYNPRIPPSSRTIFIVMPHIVSSCDVYGWDEVWNVFCVEGLRFDVELVIGDCDLVMGILAVAIERRARTMSRGYVVPMAARPLYQFARKTDAM